MLQWVESYLLKMVWTLIEKYPHIKKKTTKSQIIINPYWFIGFIEGEGTFAIKTGSALYFKVAQKNTSQ